MNRYQLLIAGVVIMTMAGALILADNSESTSDSEYIIYYLIEDGRLGEDQYSIDFANVHVTDTYVFFRTMTGSSSTQIGNLPSTENIVSRYYDTNLADDGYVLNPDGIIVDGDTVYDHSGWFIDNTYEHRATSQSTLGELDSDGDKIIFLHMRAAKVYQVNYHNRNYDGNKWTSLLFYDGHYIEEAYPAKYNQNRFGEVDYITTLYEGQTIGSNLATSDNMYCYNYTSSIQFYLPLSVWAKGDGSYTMDVYSKGGHDFTWALNTGQTSAIDVATCTPVYEGLIVNDDLDPNGDGIINLYGTSSRTSGEQTKFYITADYSLEGTSLVYLDRRVDNNGYEEEVTYYDTAGKDGNYRTLTDYELQLPEYEGFVYTSCSFESPITACSVQWKEDPDDPGVYHYYATISGRCHKDDAIYGGSVIFNYTRLTAAITITIGNTTTTKDVGYGCTLILDQPVYADHQFYHWSTVGLYGSIQSVGNSYQYTVLLEDIHNGSHTITAEWQNGADHPIYTVEYISRVDDVHIVSNTVDNNGDILLPMIQKAGYSHMGWALVNPDMDIDYDTTSLVIYPGRTSFRPSAVSSEYKIVDPENSNLITVRLYAIWCTTYTIHFDSNGGTGTMDDVGPIMVTEHYILPENTFTKNNADFIGWSMTQGGPVKYTDRASVISLSADVDGYVTLYAVWSQAEYVYVIYDKNNGTLPEGQSMNSQTVELEAGVGSVTLRDNVFYRTGYDFFGWATSFENSAYSANMSKVGDIIYLDDVPIGYADGADIDDLDTSLSLFAIWKPHTYTVTYDANGGTGSMSPQVFTYGVSQSLSANVFVKDGYFFGGWTDDQGNTYTNGFIALNLTSEDNATIALHAIWTCYYVDFYAQNETGNHDVYTAYTGVAFFIPDIMFTYPGHKFVEWNTSSDGTGTSFTPGTSILNMAPDGQTQVLYAIWAAYEYDIAFDPNGGSGSMSPIHTSGGESVALTDNTFTFTNRAFLGWSRDSNASSPEFTDGQTITDIGTGVNGETVTLYAIWSNESVTITISGLYNSNGNSVSAQNATTVLTGDLDIIRVGDVITLSLKDNLKIDNRTVTNSYSKSGKTYYLTGWEYTISGDTSSVSYGGVLTVPQSVTITAVYKNYKDTLIYHLNFPGQEDSTLTVDMGLDRTGNWLNYKYNGSAVTSECPFSVGEYPFLEGYQLCIWSTSSDDIIGAMRPQIDSFTVENSSQSGQPHNIYAVWIKIECDDGTYTGEEVWKTPNVVAYYGEESEGVMISVDQGSYSNCVHVGTASVDITLSERFKSRVYSVNYDINPAQVIVTVDSGKYKYYGVAEDPTFTGTVVCDVSQQQMALDGFSIVYTRIAGENAGNYTISASANTPNADYEITCYTSFMTIRPAEVTIEMDDASKNYGASDPAFNGTITCSTASVDVLSISFYRTNAGVNDPGVYVGVITATYTPNGNYEVTIVPATFTIYAHSDTVKYIILDGGGGGATTEDSESVPAGTPFTTKVATPNENYSFSGWFRVIYSGDTIISLIHITDSKTLDSEVITAGTYMAMFSEGDAITFNGNGGTGSMSSQEFDERSGTLSANTYSKSGYVFAGWSTATSDGNVVYNDREPLANLVLSTNGGQNVLYAVWKPVTYTSDLIWNAGGHTFTSGGSFIRTDNTGTYALVNGTDSATISASWLDALSDEQGMGLRVILNNGTIDFDSECIDTFADTGKDVTISIVPVNSHGDNGTFDVKDGDDLLVMYSITASYINNVGVRTYIHDLVGEASVTLENPGGDSVIYVGDNGDQPSDIDAGLDTISFTTDHFSLYGVVDTMDASILAEYAEYDDNNEITIVLAVALASLSMILGSIILRRRP